MRLGIVVNIMDSDAVGQTTYRLAAECAGRGHETWVMSPGQFAYDPDDKVRALARCAPARTYPTTQAFVKALRSPEAKEQWMTVDDLDVLLLRNNPSAQKPWAQVAAINFGRLAMRHGVIVLNDPNGLAKAVNKLYFQTFPEPVRPATLFTRSSERIRRFTEEHGKAVLKPLQGYGGKGVFILHPDRPDQPGNLEEIVRAVTRDGYAVVQEYLPAAAAGDTRLFLLNGVPLRWKDRYCAFRRVRSGDDLRSNISAGGRLRKAKVDDSMLELAEIVRPRLVEDGMFLVGLDIVGDRLMEINVFSPGGLGSAQMFEKVNFAEPIVNALEQKVRYMEYYRRSFNNVELATM